MQTFILVTLIALGAAAHNWRLPDYSQRPFPLLQRFRYGVWNMMKPVENIYYQNGFSQWNPQQYYPQENLNDHVSYDNAEWICRAPKTGDMLIIVPETKDQKEDQSKESFHNSEKDHDPKENDMKSHAGEGLIEARIGS